jgi:multidrug efflux pump subunit AcrA (membrane-fusion protein)
MAGVRLLRRPRYESAVGTVRPVHETAVASKLLAKVIAVNVKAGQVVARDEILVQLDAADLEARVMQAEAALAAAKSAQEQAKADYERAQQLREGKAISRADFDKFETALRTTKAELDRGEQAVLWWAARCHYMTRVADAFQLPLERDNVFKALKQ